MRFGVIGPLEVRTDDHVPVVVPGAKERLLLAVLVASAPAVVSTDRLVDTLWDGVPPVTARKSLQAHVVRLRSTLEPDRPKGSTGRYVVRRGAGYALAVERAAIDALHIGDLAARGRAQLASGNAQQAVRQLTAALDLWRGEPYADWPDAQFADAERRRLAEVRVGAVTGLLEVQLALGRHADVVPELERLIADEPLREGWWRLLMLALYRGGRQAEALAAGRRVRALLAEELGADPGPGLREVERAILAQDPALLPTPSTGLRPGSGPDGPRDGFPRTVSGSCPYKGLAAYQVEDAPLFHGRRRLVAGLVRSLVDAPVLVVSGPSGAGKSSVVRAGLLPALAEHALPGSGDWQPVIVTPGRRPVDTLASLTGESPPSVPVVLVCDQLEELWAPGSDPAERIAFLDAVLGLIDDEVIVRCVAVVRGDHVGRLAEHADFTDRFGGALVLVPPLTDPELRDVVTEPAQTVGLSVEPELLDAVVGDVLGQAAALPLLSTALVGTWERRRGDLLTLAGYLEAGGVEGALTRSAEAAYAALGEEGQRLAQQMLVRLADSDDSGMLVRRRVPLGELDLDGDGDGRVRRTIVDTFVDRRLLTVDRDRLEVAHEALLTSWPRLARWLQDDAAGRAVRRHLTPAALEWDQGGRPADELYRGARLSAALDWAAAPDADAAPLEREFLDASQAQAEADLRNARDRERRTRRLAVGLAGVLVLALLGAGLAVRYQRAAAARAVDAAAASTVADANRLAALSTTARSLDLSLLLAAQAVRLAQTPETEDGLLASLVEHRRAERIASIGSRPDHASVANGSVLFIALGEDIAAWTVGSAAPPRKIMDFWDGWDVVDASPTEDLLAGAGYADDQPWVRGYADDQPWVRVVAKDGSQRHLAEGDAVGGQPLEVEFTADGRRLVVPVATPTGTGEDWRWEIREVDVATGAVTSMGIRGRSSAEPSMTLSEDAETAVVWTDDPGGAVTVIDVERDRRVRFHPDRRPVTIDDFIPFADGIAQLWNDGAVTLYDRGGRSVQAIEVRQAPIRMTVVSPDGTWAATAGDGGVVDVWDIDTSTGRWSQRESLVGHAGNIVIAQTDPAGRLLFTVSVDGTIIVWNMTDDAGFGDSYPGLGDRWISNRPQIVEPGRLLVAPTRPMSRSAQVHPERPDPDTASVAATFLNPETGRVVEQVDVGDTVDSFPFGSSVAVSPDRRKVAVTSGFATTVLDTRTRAVLGKVVLPPAGGESPAGAPLPAEIVWGAGWTPDGARLLLGVEGSPDEGGDGGLVVVDPSTWRIERRIDIGEVQSIEASPDGRLLAVASAYPIAEVSILDPVTLEREHTVPLGRGDFPADLSFSPDGRHLAVGGEFGLVYVFDTATWRLTHAPGRVHDERLGQVEWMPDGRTVITSGADETVSLFDVTRGLVRAGPLPASTDVGEGHTHLVPGIADEIIALSGERAGRRYPMEPSRWLAQACTVAGRDLTRTEWSRYVPDRPYQRTCSDLS